MRKLKFGDDVLRTEDIPDPAEIADDMTVAELRALIAQRFPAATPRRTVAAMEMLIHPMKNYDLATFVGDPGRDFPFLVGRFVALHPQMIVAVHWLVSALLGRAESHPATAAATRKAPAK